MSPAEVPERRVDQEPIDAFDSDGMGPHPNPKRRIADPSPPRDSRLGPETTPLHNGKVLGRVAWMGQINSQF